MSKGYKISSEIKSEIIKKIKEQGIPVSQTAEDYGVNPRTIYDWLGKGTKGAPTWNEFNKLRKEKDELLKIVGELTVKVSKTQKKI